MIALLGAQADEQLADVRVQLEMRGRRVLALDPVLVADWAASFSLDCSEFAGQLKVGDRELSLEQVTAIYNRLVVDPQPTRTVKAITPDKVRKTHELLRALQLWLEVSEGMVVNRTSAMGSNASKPYQSQQIQALGLFSVPETLVTNDPDVVLDFMSQHDRVIFKSISGVRSVVQELTPCDSARLESVLWCPTQFQAYIEGRDLRVHTVGERTFATAIESDAIDYRYANRRDQKVGFRPVTLPDETSERCVALAAALRLPLSGIDLRITHDGQLFCFEVNPSPAFAYYERMTGQRISNSVANLLDRGV